MTGGAVLVQCAADLGGPSLAGTFQGSCAG